MAGLSSRALATSPENRLHYNGKEEQRREFSDGAGMEWLDYDARIYDPQVGKMNQIDPHSMSYFNETPYCYGANNPIIYIDPSGKDRIRTTYTTFELGEGQSITFSRTQLVNGDLQKVAVFDSKCNVTGYDWFDIQETQSVIYNSSGQKVGGSTSYMNGEKRTHTSINNETWAKLKVDWNRGEKFREGGGIIFTSSQGRGGGPVSRYADASPESIDKLLSGISISGTAIKQENISSLKKSFEYLKDAVSTYSSLQDADYQPIKFNLEPNGTQCLLCSRKEYHGPPAVRGDTNGLAKDTIKLNPKTGKIDTIPTKKKN